MEQGNVKRISVEHQQRIKELLAEIRKGQKEIAEIVGKECFDRDIDMVAEQPRCSQNYDDGGLMFLYKGGAYIGWYDLDNNT